MSGSGSWLVSGERIPAPASVARPGIVSVDQHGGGSRGDQFVGQRCADQSAADHHDVGSGESWCHDRIIAEGDQERTMTIGRAGP